MRSLFVALLLFAIGCGMPPDGICDDTNNPCKSGHACVLGVCQPAVPVASVAPTCTDGIKNQGETDVDCGGPCTPCGASLGCSGAQDCASSTCVNNHCACPAGQHIEGTACVGNSDPACGPDRTDCTQAFPGGTGVCNAPAGTCVLTACGTATHLCNNACASNTSTQTCGPSSCSPCAVPANGSAVCTGGACAMQCNAGYHRNAAACEADSNTACGSPTTNCTTAFPHGTGACSASTASTPASCVLTGCAGGYHPSGNLCQSDLTSSCSGVNCTDAAHQDPHGTMTCNSGVCAVASCNQGYHPNANSSACDVSSNTCCGPGPGCKDCTSGYANGAGACTTSTSTPNGLCSVSTCVAGYHPDSSSNSCVPNSDTACGSPPADCTKVTNGAGSCNFSQGTCAFTCSPGYHAYNGACEGNSDAICGASRTNCTALYPNGTGKCDAGGNCFFAGCVGGYHTCNGSCVSDTSTNSCGSSCTPCPGDPNGTAYCSGGSCAISCTTGYNRCGGGSCVLDTKYVCGRGCFDCSLDGSGFTCSSGTCKCFGTTCKL